MCINTYLNIIHSGAVDTKLSFNNVNILLLVLYVSNPKFNYVNIFVFAAISVPGQCGSAVLKYVLL
jgi:hypothetical protein